MGGEASSSFPGKTRQLDRLKRLIVHAIASGSEHSVADIPIQIIVQTTPFRCGMPDQLQMNMSLERGRTSHALRVKTTAAAATTTVAAIVTRMFSNVIPSQLR